MCIEAPVGAVWERLANLEEIATRSLLTRLPHLRLNGDPEWRGSFPLRELEHLPVRWN